METYFNILPNDLKYNLSLYLNYRDTIVSCALLNCQTVGFWLNKIRNELGYDNDFIKEYVYDLSTHTQKTLLPLNEKYLELKARKGVDFGTEFYNTTTPLLYRTSQLRDFALANELLDYLLKFIDDFHLESQVGDDVLKQLIKGAASSDNVVLINQLIALSDRRRNPYKLRMPKTFIKEFALVSLITGAYEGNSKGNQVLLDRYNIIPTTYPSLYMISGLVSGNHLRELINRNVSKIDSPGAIAFAYIDNAKDVINYYKLPLSPEFIDRVITYGQIQFLPPLEMLSTMDQQSVESVIESLLEYGYLELIKTYNTLMSYQNVISALVGIMIHNHLDILNYVYSLYSSEIKRGLNGFFVNNINSVIPRCILETIKFLYNNGLLTRQHINLITDSSKTVIRQYNPEVLEFLQNVG